MTAIGRNGATSWTSGPLWLRQRALGKNHKKRRMRTSHDLMRRLKQEACFDGHRGCVNCLEWNSRGDLLASGSDDCNVIVWDVFRQRKQCLVQTGHESNIFSVKFMPASNDGQVVTSAGDGQVRLTDTLKNESLLVCKSCHDDRVKRLAVHPSEPNLIWSAGEEGYILQYDIRQSHVCNSSKPTNLLIDLKTISKCVAAKCIAVNPLRSEMLAVGSNDIYNRLFDRRALRSDAAQSCTAYFAPGHLLKTNNRSNNLQSYGTTYLAFNSDGTELLASVHAEQVYLFNTYEPGNKYRSFDLSIKPLLVDRSPESQAHKPSSLQPCPNNFNQKLNDHDDCKAVCSDLLSGDNTSRAPNNNATIDYINDLLARVDNCPDLYRARAIALTRRGWRGDYYQALRDCCSALALKPLDFKTIRCLTTTLIKIGDKKDVCGLLDFVEGAIKQFGDHDELLRSKEMLLTFKRSPSPNQGGCIEDERDVTRCSKSFDFSRRYCGHCNMNTDIKEANFFGGEDEFIVGGSDDGAFYIWDKNTTNIVKAVHADYQILNCVQPHPNICMLATSGIEPTVKMWSTSGNVSRDVEALETRCSQNQKHISTDPLEAMYMMLYPSRV